MMENSSADVRFSVGRHPKHELPQRIIDIVSVPSEGSGQVSLGIGIDKDHFLSLSH